MPHPGDPYFELRIVEPETFKCTAFSLALDRTMFWEVFAPLPRERELFAAAALAAEQQLQLRRRMVEDIAAHLAREILGWAQSRDPQRGYSPEEWRRMNRQPDAPG